MNPEDLKKANCACKDQIVHLPRQVTAFSFYNRFRGFADNVVYTCVTSIRSNIPKYERAYL